VEHARLVQGHKQQLILVRHDQVAVQQITELAALNGAGAHLGHGGGGEAFGQELQNVLVGRQGGASAARRAM
jgi:hypothetical protein